MSRQMNSTTKRSPANRIRSASTISVPRAGVSHFEPAADEVARLAYFYWQARGCPDGSAEEDWLKAEAELRERAARGAN